MKWGQNEEVFLNLISDKRSQCPGFLDVERLTGIEDSTRPADASLEDKNPSTI